MSDSNENNSNIFINTITAEDFERATLENSKEVETFEWNGLNIEVRRVLPLNEMIEFVDYVIDLCFNGETGEYMPEVRDFALTSATIMFYTNIALPLDTSLSYTLLYHSGIVSEIYKHICPEQFGDICGSIRMKLDHLSSSDVFAMHKEIDKSINLLNDILNQISSIFDGVESGDIANVLGALSRSGLDEGKLFSAITESMNSDAQRP